MSGMTLKAHFDGKNICPDEPCELPLNTALVVTVVPETDETLDEERAAWFELSRRGFARAYGDDEPDYSAYVGRFLPAE